MPPPPLWGPGCKTHTELALAAAYLININLYRDEADDTDDEISVKFKIPWGTTPTPRNIPAGARLIGGVYLGILFGNLFGYFIWVHLPEDIGYPAHIGEYAL